MTLNRWSWTGSRWRNMGGKRDRGCGVPEIIESTAQRAAPAVSARTQAPVVNQTLAEEAHEKIASGFVEMQSAVYAGLQVALAEYDKKQEPGLFGKALAAVSRAASSCGYITEENSLNIAGSKLIVRASLQKKGTTSGNTITAKFEADGRFPVLNNYPTIQVDYILLEWKGSASGNSKGFGGYSPSGSGTVSGSAKGFTASVTTTASIKFWNIQDIYPVSVTVSNSYSK